MPLHVVPKTEPPPETPAQKVGKRLAKSARPAEMLQCHRCGGREVIETKVGVLYQAGRTRGGTKQILCAACLMKGERVVLA
jgi:hypothetical protein